jgi:hypothetical protein
MPDEFHPSAVFRRAAMVLFLVLLTFPLAGQVENHLILKKNGFRNRLHFLAGDDIKFVRQGSKSVEETYLQGIGTDCIIVSGQEVPISDIRYLIHYRTGFNFSASGKAMMIASPGYLVIGFINALFAGISPVPTVTNLVVAGSLLTAGAILPRFQVRKFPIGKKFTLKIVQSDPALNR